MRGRCRFAAVIALCGSLHASTATAQDLLIFAAASLRDALGATVRLYESTTGVRVVESYAGSGTLARQIERGAPADIFISADSEWMDYLEKRGLIKTGTRVDLLSNRLVLIAPAESTVSLTIEKGFPLAEALGNSRLAMANPDSVPAGKYGRAALKALGVWPTVSRKIARTENVRVALTYVARGEAPFGVVYRTDALVEPRVRIVGEFAPNSYPQIVYSAAVVARSKSVVAEKALEFLHSREAREIWVHYGFGVKSR